MSAIINYIEEEQCQNDVILHLDKLYTINNEVGSYLNKNLCIDNNNKHISPIETYAVNVQRMDRDSNIVKDSDLDTIDDIHDCIKSPLVPQSKTQCSILQYSLCGYCCCFLSGGR